MGFFNAETYHKIAKAELPDPKGTGYTYIIMILSSTCSNVFNSVFTCWTFSGITNT